MTLTQRPERLPRTQSLLHHIIGRPELCKALQALPTQTFAALVREIGVEDAAELVALATTEQLVQAFDEDLFVSERAGERESLDIGRFITWLEVLLEAGEEAAAGRIAELDEDFVAHALGGVLLVLEEDALRGRLDEGDEDEARLVDKSLEGALTEDLDGYILVAKRQDGWDAVLALLLALDRDHRPLLVRLMDRLARVGSGYLDDLDELSTVLTEGEALAEDAEAAREERLRKQGYVEPRAARAFLSLARKPLTGDPRPSERDPLTKAYFRDVERARPSATSGWNAASRLLPLPPAVLRQLGGASPSVERQAPPGASSSATSVDVFMEALRQLARDAPDLFSERMEELSYLANVVVAGHERDGGRLRPNEAAGAVLATVCFGVHLEVQSGQTKARRAVRPTGSELMEALRRRSADLLFRIASSALASGASGVPSTKQAGLLYSSDELEAAIRRARVPSRE